MQLPQFPSRPTCTACELHSLGVRSVGVPSTWVEGTLTPGPNTPAVIMLGQNPGLQEDYANTPFIGRSGKLVRSVYIAESMRSLASFYLFNTARCYTPPEAPPRNKHYNACIPHSITDLKEVIRCHSPSPSCLDSSSSPASHSSPRLPSSRFGNGYRVAVLALGAPAASTLLKTLRGKAASQSEAMKLQGHVFTVDKQEIAFFATYHPAFILRKPPVIHAVKDHIQLVNDWLLGTICSPSKPILLSARPPT